MLLKARLKPIIAVFLAVLASAVAAASGTANEGPWWLGHVVTIIAAAIAASIAAAMIVWQLGRQHKNAMALQSENFKSELKLKVYQELSAALASAADHIGRAATYGATAVVHSRIYGQQLAQGMQPSPVSDRALELMDRHGKVTNAAIAVVYVIEKYIIIHPDIDIFKMAIASAVHDATKTFQALFEFMLIYLPAEDAAAQDMQPSNGRALSADELEKFDTLAQAYFNALIVLDCYLSDMRIELQMLLLGGLFANRLERRQPPDPQVKVISLDAPAVAHLRAHFLQETEWGKSAAQIKQDVQREFADASRAN